MARHDRCIICDYTQANGSGMAGLAPGQNGRVRRFGESFYCDVCSVTIDQAKYSLRPPEEVDEELVLLEE